MINRIFNCIVVVLIATNILFTSSVNAQWTDMGAFPDASFIGSTMGIAVDPDGKVWWTCYSNSIPWFNGTDTIATNGIKVFNADGTEADFSPIAIIETSGGLVVDTLTGFARGLTADQDGNIIYVQSGLNKMFKIDYKTGLGIARHDITEIGSSPTSPGIADDGTIFVGPVVGGGSTQIAMYDTDLNYIGSAVDGPPNISRCLEVSHDGNTIYWPPFTGSAMFIYKRADEFSAFELADSALADMSIETIRLNPDTDLLWVSSDTRKTTYSSVKWFAYDTDAKTLVDSFTYTPKVPDVTDMYPRGLAFTDDGMTAYVGTFSSVQYGITKYEFDGTPTPTVTVTSPNGGEDWEVGSSHNIAWSSQDVANVKIEYSTNDGSSWTTVVSSTPSDGSYAWTIPNTPSTQCKLRISDATDGIPVDISNTTFTIGAFQIIALASPNGGENWFVGSIHNIIWSSQDVVNVKIEYSTNDGSSWTTVVSSTPSDGSYAWTIPNTPSTQCKVRISDASDNIPIDISSTSFIISNPTIAVISPNGGENWFVGSTQYITWSSQDIINAKIEYSTDDESSWSTIISSTSSNGIYLWTVPNTNSTQCKVRISDASNSSITDISNSTFTISTSLNQSIALSSPNGGENWLVGSNYNITWSSQGISNIKIEYSTNNGSSWTNVVASTPSSSGSYSWTVPNNTSTQCKVRISDATDGNPVDESDAYFSITEETSNLVMYYPFSGASDDLGIYSNNLNVEGAILTSDRFGNENRAYSFDGANDYMYSTNQIDWNRLLEDVTISIWVYPTSYRHSVDNFGTLLGQLFNNCESRTDMAEWFAFGMGSFANKEVGPNFDIYSENGRVSGYQNFNSVFELNKWYHIVATISSKSTIELYLDGQLVKTVSLASSFSVDVLSKMYLGFNKSIADHRDSYYYEGKLDDIKIYDYSLTSNEISDLYIENGWEGYKELTLTSPNGGENWEIGSSHNIAWVSQDITNVKIEYSTNNGSSWTNVVASTPASSGSYAWTIPNTVSTECKVRISDVTNSSIADISNSTFTISAALNPTITLTSPNGGENWKVSSNQNITWSSQNIANVNIEYSTNNGSSWANVVASTPASNGSYSWTVPNSTSSLCKVRISDETDGNPVDESDAYFSITEETSNLVMYYPFSGASDDLGIYSNNLNVEGAILTSDRFENENSAYSFDGVDDFMSTVDQIDWNNLMEDVTISLWVYPTSYRDPVDNFGALLGQLFNNCESRTDIAEWFAFGMGDFINKEVGPTFNIYSEEGGVSGYGNRNSIFELNKWYHIVTTISSRSTIELYLDGQSVLNVSLNNNFSTDVLSKLYLGFNKSVADHRDSYYYEGKLDDIKIYNYSLTSDEISDLYKENGWEGYNELTLTSPMGGESWTIGSSHNITWVSQNIANVKIEYSANNGSNWTSVVASTPASSGSYSWTVPNTASTQCKVRISDASNSSITDISNSKFTVISNVNGSWTDMGAFPDTSFIGGTTGIAVDPDGKVWWTSYYQSIPWFNGTDTINTSGIYVFNADGTEADFSPIGAVTTNGGLTVDTLNDYGHGLVADQDGNIVYVQNRKIFKINYQTGEGMARHDITEVGSNPTEPGISDDGTIFVGPIIGDRTTQIAMYDTDLNYIGSAVDAPPGSSTCLEVSHDGNTIYWPSFTGSAMYIYKRANEFSPFELADSALTGMLIETARLNPATDLLWVSSDDRNTTYYSSITWYGVDTETFAIVDSFAYTPLVPEAHFIQARGLDFSTDGMTAYVGTFSLEQYGITKFEFEGTLTQTLTVTSPNGGENWLAGSSHDITWNSQDIVNVKIEYTTNNGSSWTTIASSTPSDGIYSWTIPNSVSTQQGKVRISDATNSSITDISNSTFTISGSSNPTVTLTSPNGGDTCIVSYDYIITWSSKDVTNVKIEYTTDGTIWTEIISSTESDGSYIWIVPNTPSTNCKVRISDVTNSNITDISNAFFTISNSVNSTATIISPNGGENWIAGSSHDITWSSQNVSNVWLQYTVNNGAGWGTIVEEIPSTGRYTWTIPNFISENCKVRIIDTNILQVLDESDTTFTIGNTLNPIITLSSPNGGENWLAGSSQSITWISQNVTNVNLDYTTNNGTSWTEIVASTPSGGSYLWTIPSVQSDMCKVRIMDVTDPNIKYESLGVFSILNPTVSLTSPNGSESWISGSSQNITWSSENIDSVKLEYSTNNGTDWSVIENSIIASATPYLWEVPVIESENYLIRISDVRYNTIYDLSDTKFTIALPPLVELTYPNGNEMFDVGDEVIITWDSRNVEQIILESSMNGGADWTPIATDLANSKSYTWTIPNTPSVDCFVKISAVEDALVIDQSDNSFVIYPLTVPVVREVSFGNVKEDESFRMVGLPGNGNLALSNVLQGEYGNSWKAYYDNGQEGTSSVYLEEYDGSSKFNFKPGLGFWIVAQETLKVNETFESVPVNDGLATIELNNGWNVISNPFELAVKWEEITLLNGLNNASDVIYQYDGTYSISTNFEPYVGYYYLNDDVGVTSLKIPYHSNERGGLAKIRDIVHNDISLKFSDSRLANNFIKLGFREDALNGFDKYDIYFPRYIGREGMVVSNSLLDNFLIADYRKEIGEGVEYNLQINLKQDQRYKLNISGLENYQEYEVILIDTRLSKVYYFDEEMIEIKSLHKENNFKLLFGTNEFIENEIKNLVPKEYLLYQNYPNPFNPSTVIRFSLPKESKVELKIYSVIGEEVTTLIPNQSMSAGNHEVELSSPNLASGVYFYRIIADEFTDVKKLVLVK